MQKLLYRPPILSIEAQILKLMLIKQKAVTCIADKVHETISMWLLNRKYNKSKEFDHTMCETLEIYLMLLVVELIHRSYPSILLYQTRRFSRSQRYSCRKIESNYQTYSILFISILFFYFLYPLCVSTE